MEEETRLENPRLAGISRNDRCKCICKIPKRSKCMLRLDVAMRFARM